MTAEIWQTNCDECHGPIRAISADVRHAIPDATPAEVLRDLADPTA